MYNSITFIGAGRVSTSLGLYFKNSGREIKGYYSRNYQSAQQSAQQTGSQAFMSLEQLIEESDMIWITTPDDQISSVTQQIIDLNVNPKDEKLILHASGTLSLTALHPLQNIGYNTACAHPLMAFDNSHVSIEKLQKAWFAVEAEGNVLGGIENFFETCGNKTFFIPSEMKPLYHAAACVMSNYLVTLLHFSYKMFETAGMSPEAIQLATQTLLDSTLCNIRDKSGLQALTGPIKRGDKATVTAHLNTLKQHMPSITQLYKNMGLYTMKMINDYRLKDILD